VWYNPAIVKRIFRILLNAATVRSLVLCVATVVLWVQDYFINDRLRRSGWADEGDCSQRTQDMFLDG
jgi:hypothetical protein